MNAFAGLVIAVALLAQYRGGPALGLDVASAVALAAMLSAAASIRAERALARRALAFASGAACAAIAWHAPALACATAIFVLAVLAFRAVALDLACAVLALAALKSFGSIGWFGAAFVSLKALVVVVLLERPKQPRDARVQRLVAPLLLLFTFALVVRRLVAITGTATNDGAVFWAEEPFLVDMMKLDAHQPLYGPIEQLDSYTYSPLMQLAHHSFLAPFHAQLSLFPNRLLTLFDQLVATVMFAWAIAPRVRPHLERFFPFRPDMFVLALAALAGFSNLLAGAIHPDHPTLACVAIAFALAVRGDAFPRWLYWPLIVIVTPVAVMLKLTGAGIGIGLAAVFLLERRFRELGALAVSGALSVATIPLFDATCGHFSAYALGIQRSHPLEWIRLVHAPTVQFAAAAALALAISFGVGPPAEGDARRLLRSTCVYFACVSLAFFPAYVKYAGRENNLVVVLVGSVVLLVVASLRDVGRALLLPASALYIVALTWTPSAAGPPSPLTLDEQLAAAESTLADDDAHHEPTWASATLRIRHGDRTPPRDCINIAYELFYGKRPEAELFFAHLGDGRYRSIVMVSSDLQVDGTLRGAFAARLNAALEPHYERIYPTIDVPDEVNHFVIFRHKR